MSIFSSGTLNTLKATLPLTTLKGCIWQEWSQRLTTQLLPYPILLCSTPNSSKCNEQGTQSRERLCKPCLKEVTDSNSLNFLLWSRLSQYLSFRAWYTTKQEEIDSCLLSHLLNLTGRSSLLKLFLFGKAWREVLTLLSFIVAVQVKCSSILHQHVLTLLPSTSLLFIIKLIALFVSKCITANRYSRI